ncbi:hypothetical protein ACFYS8_02900 [Kitasatospora sp. NPDC004615]|uniref:hypothetical protein n=1 Tax=unclassified Kitasatospora TaxID=2633591 RepID=UPI0036CF2D0A
MTEQPEQRPAPLHVFLSDTAAQTLGRLRPGELDVVEKLIERLAVHPRLGIPVPGGTDPEVDDYTARTDPAAEPVTASASSTACTIRCAPCS